MSARSASARRANIATALLLLVVLPPLTAHAMPKLVEQHNWLLLDRGIAAAVAAMSLNLLLGYAGQISLGHAGLLGVGAFTAGNLVSRIHLPMVLATVVAIVVSAAVALVIGVPALRLRGLYLAIATVLFALAMQYSVFPSHAVSSGSAGVAVPRLLWGHRYLTDNAVFASICFVLLVLAWVVDDNIVRTRVGRAFRVIKENEAVAQSFGVDVVRYKLMAFVVSGAMAGLAGAMYGQTIGHVDSATFDLMSWSLPLVIMVIVGGMGHRLAVVIAAFFFMLLPDVLGSLHAIAPIIGSALLMLTIARHPEGMADLLTSRRRPATPVDDGDTSVPALPELPLPTTSLRPGVVPHPRSTGPLLEIENVTVRFGGLTAVDQASLEVPHGRIVGLIGPNGAGKSTLFNAVSGLVRTEGGIVRFRGEPIQDLRSDQRARLGIARSFQQVGLAMDLSVRGNLLLAQHQLAAYGDASALLMLPGVAHREGELRERADAAIAALGFADAADKPVKFMSGGQQRIVEIACLLLTAPDLVMLDEPSAGMAPGVAEQLADRLRELRDALGRTVLLIEHNVPLVMDTCDYVYVLDAGRVIASGTPAEITADMRVVEAYFGAAPEPPRPAVPKRTRKTAGARS
jgi:ABC-type branched-subunit amino acid transport system ATPase component/ABC-type branched-subunit amino acid transport system permease subunit